MPRSRSSRVAGGNARARSRSRTARAARSGRRAAIGSRCTGSRDPRWPSTSPAGSTSERALPVGAERDEARDLLAARDHALQHETDPRRVELALQQLGLQWRPILGHEDLVETAERDVDLRIEVQHHADVLGVASVELLSVRLADHRLAEHRDPGLRTIDARLPGPFRGDDLAVLVLGRVLAEVPDVPEPILCVPVEGVLGEL